MENNETKLNPRQRALRRFLWNHRTEWQSSKDIFNGVKGYISQSTAYKQINEDVHTINLLGNYHKIIITDRVNGYKLATKEEFEEWADKAKQESEKKISYVYLLIRKSRKDGQGIIPNLEGFKKEFYDIFVREE